MNRCHTASPSVRRSVEDRPRVVDLVAGGDEQDIRVGLGGEVAEVRLLALPPGRLRLPGDRDGVAAGHDDPRDPLAELLLDHLMGRLAVLRILDRVVEQRGDGDVLVGAVLEGQRADRHDVRHVRDARLLAHLRPVDRPRECERRGEATGQRWRGLSPFGHRPIVGDAGRNEARRGARARMARALLSRPSTPGRILGRRLHLRAPSSSCGRVRLRTRPAASVASASSSWSSCSRSASPTGTSASRCWC